MVGACVICPGLVVRRPGFDRGYEQPRFMDVSNEDDENVMDDD